MHIDTHFFMDTFFTMKKAGKSSHGHTCCELLITDTGFLHVVPMRRNSDVVSALKQIAKVIGAPDAVISGAAKEQTSQPLCKFSEIGTTL